METGPRRDPAPEAEEEDLPYLPEGLCVESLLSGKCDWKFSFLSFFFFLGELRPFTGAGLNPTCARGRTDLPGWVAPGGRAAGKTLKERNLKVTYLHGEECLNKSNPLSKERLSQRNVYSGGYNKFGLLKHRNFLISSG